MVNNLSKNKSISNSSNKFNNKLKYFGKIIKIKGKIQKKKLFNQKTYF